MLRFIINSYLLLLVYNQGFRTLYVEVYLWVVLSIKLEEHCFRTLYVEVYQILTQNGLPVGESFRTLYVEVYLDGTVEINKESI